MTNKSTPSPPTLTFFLLFIVFTALTYSMCVDVIRWLIFIPLCPRLSWSLLPKPVLPIFFNLCLGRDGWKQYTSVHVGKGWLILDPGQSTSWQSWGQQYHCRKSHSKDNSFSYKNCTGIIKKNGCSFYLPKVNCNICKLSQCSALHETYSME